MKPVLLLLAACVLAAGEYTTYIGDQNTWSIAQVLTDASGNTYVAGSRTFDLSSDPFHPDRASEAILAKIDANGKTVLFANIGGKGNDAANAIAIDPAGNIYIGGSTTSPNFPVRNALYTTASRGFIVKYTPSATDVLWSTYFPAPVTALAADATGVYVTGTVATGGFPTTPGLPAASTTFRNYGAYLTKIAAGGDRLVYSTVISGSDKPCGCCSSCFTSWRGASSVGVGLDAAGNAYFGGNSDVVDLPTTAAAHVKRGAGAWVAKVNTAGTALGYLTYLTADGLTISPNFLPATSMAALAVDQSGRVYVAGSSFEPYLPASTVGPLPPTDVLALALNPDGTDVVWAKYLGGASQDESTAAALDPAGNFWVSGTTGSYEFPNENGWSTGDDFIVAFNPAGAVTYSGKYPSGTVKKIAVDASRLLHVSEPGGVLSAIAPDPHPAVRPWFVGPDGGQIAPSEVISLYGPHIGGLPVTIDGIAPQILYTSDEQVNLITPSSLTGTASIRIGNGPAFSAVVIPTAPQIFGALNEDGTVNSPEHPAKVGSVMAVWVTGFGAVTDPASVFAGFIGDAGGASVRWLYSGQAPGLPAGVGQINFLVPESWGITLVAGDRMSAVFPIYVSR